MTCAVCSWMIDNALKSKLGISSCFFSPIIFSAMPQHYFYRSNARFIQASPISSLISSPKKTRYGNNLNHLLRFVFLLVDFLAFSLLACMHSRVHFHSSLFHFPFPWLWRHFFTFVHNLSVHLHPLFNPRYILFHGVNKKSMWNKMSEGKFVCFEQIVKLHCTSTFQNGWACSDSTYGRWDGQKHAI